MIHDAYCRDVCARNPNMLVPWWIMAAWAYEVANDPILSDACFDALVIDLDRQWDTIVDHHKDLLDRALLKSAIAIGDRWPLMAIHASQSLQRATISPPDLPPMPPGLKEFLKACAEPDLFGGAA